jgi:hypothetical protein
MLFKRGAVCEQYKRPQKIYDFKNKVVSAMKAHYERVSAPGSHSTSNDPGDHEDLSEMDQLCMRLYVEYQEALDIQEAIKCNNLLDKENVTNASQFLAPNPQPFPCSVAVTHHPLSAMSNEAPALVKPLFLIEKKASGAILTILYRYKIANYLLGNVFSILTSDFQLK